MSTLITKSSPALALGPMFGSVIEIKYYPDTHFLVGQWH